ncbi:acyltransferase [Photobacterium sp.]|uniref:acyltransferase n=1 Tax=Photobacterium sp. TaxID=660 RepID=UPI00299EE0C7|nr:acyltransferase [Photobacterium sp.]MDX1302722.1 acyltransferase [Photobacterium sp.]
MREKVWFFDLLRCLAAVAVVVIHVLGPYRDQLGVITDNEWITAISFNSFSRWAVPIFIMITGALMLSDARDFEAKYYVKRRLGKVLLPFLVWSVFYSVLSGLTRAGFDPAVALQTLQALPVHETYYHLGFFYYFIPLYFVVPFFQWLVRKYDRGSVVGITGVWLALTTLFLFKVDGFWSHELILYSGYLLLGYCLFRFRWPSLPWLLPLGIAALLLTDYMVVSNSLMNGEYTVGRWLSYKTLNTVLIAAMIFAVCQRYGEQPGEFWRQKLAFMSRYSLGIYLLHPVFLWPVREFSLYFAHPIIMIPFWTLICGGLALIASWLLAKSSKTAWLVP